MAPCFCFVPRFPVGEFGPAHSIRLHAASVLVVLLQVKIADFGVARMIETSGHMTAETGTYRWMAPEVIEHKPYDEKADVFSFGVVMWELLTCKVRARRAQREQTARSGSRGVRTFGADSWLASARAQTCDGCVICSVYHCRPTWIVVFSVADASAPGVSYHSCRSPTVT